jgi:PKD repeat protein
VKGTSIAQGPQAFAVCLNQPPQPLPLGAVITASAESGDAPLAVNFTGRYSTGIVTAYAWDLGDGTTANTVDVSHTYTQPGDYTVTLTVTGMENGVSTTKGATKVIHVSGPVILASPDTGPAPLAVSFTPLNPRADLTYTWDFGDGSAPVSGASTAHTYTVPGFYAVTLTVKNAGGNEVKTTHAINVVQAVVDGFPSRARAKFDFINTRNDLQFTMVVPQLVHTRQQAREAIRDGTFEGNSYDIFVYDDMVLNGVSLATVTLDRRGTFKSRTTSFKLNLLKGEITVRLKASDVARNLGISAATDIPTLNLRVSVSGLTTAYQATFALTYKTNGQRGTGISR